MQFRLQFSFYPIKPDSSNKKTVDIRHSQHRILGEIPNGLFIMETGGY